MHFPTNFVMGKNMLYDDFVVLKVHWGLVIGPTRYRDPVGPITCTRSLFQAVWPNNEYGGFEIGSLWPDKETVSLSGGRITRPQCITVI